MWCKKCAENAGPRQTVSGANTPACLRFPIAFIRGRMPFRLAERAPGAHHQLPTEEIQRPSSRNCIGKQSPYTQRFSRASYRRRSNTRLITTLCS